MKTTTRIRPTAIAVMLLASSLPVMAEWTRITESSRATIYIDLNTIRSGGDFRKIWEMMDFKSRDQFGALSAVLRVEYDCKNEARRILAMSSYDEPMAKGKTIGEITSGNAQWSEAPPDSVGETLMETVCPKK